MNYITWIDVVDCNITLLLPFLNIFMIDDLRLETEGSQLESAC